ncbi:MAG: YggT family protein [Candidatus Hydrogenedentota bacterium]|nr:MAG: YggT family protein [Candidatus Hydrogenedentota bacterium]
MGNLIVELLQLYSLLIIIRAVLSWMRIDPRNQLVRILYALTDPVLDPIQRVIPPIGGTIDISPIIALFFVQLLREVVIRIFW